MSTTFEIRSTGARSNPVAFFKIAMKIVMFTYRCVFCADIDGVDKVTHVIDCPS